jgi:hypothetical protein
MIGTINATICMGELRLSTFVGGERFAMRRDFEQNYYATLALGEAITKFQQELKNRFPDAAKCSTPALEYEAGRFQFRLALPGTQVQDTIHSEWIFE